MTRVVVMLITPVAAPASLVLDLDACPLTQGVGVNTLASTGLLLRTLIEIP